MLLLIGLPACTGGTAFAQNYHFGMNTRVLTAQMADKMTELGAGVVRLAYGWDVIEPTCKGCYNWQTTDAWRDEARRTHRAIFASLAYTPAWANGGHPYQYPPLNYQDWYDFVYATVSRYRNDIYLWGVWNEPNLNGYLKGSDPRVYRSLAVMAHAAVRAAGFENVSVDLIYAIPGQSLADWRAGLRAAAALEPDHLSLYALQLVLAPDEWAAPPRPGALRWRQRMVVRQGYGFGPRLYAV